jgi:hypothetical protein
MSSETLLTIKSPDNSQGDLRGDSQGDSQDKCDSWDREYFIDKGIKRTSTANFLLCSNENTYYKGEIYKRFGVVPAEIWAVAKLRMLPKIMRGFEEFYSYKFRHPIDNIPRIFCVTFRKKYFKGWSFRNTKPDDIDKYHIRLSLIKESQESPQPAPGTRFIPIIIECRTKGNTKEGIGESLILDSNGNEGTPPVFSSITRGSVIHEGSGSVYSEVLKMNVLREGDVPPYIIATTERIKENIERLGKILVQHCYGATGVQTNEGRGGATRRHTRLTRRRKSVFKRKGKKSYRKKKYGKTKKSRRFRRSIRSRR